MLLSDLAAHNLDDDIAAPSDRIQRPGRTSKPDSERMWLAVPVFAGAAGAACASPGHEGMPRVSTAAERPTARFFMVLSQWQGNGERPKGASHFAYSLVLLLH